MNFEVQPESPPEEQIPAGVVAPWLLQTAVFAFLQAGCLFLAAGYLDWVAAWIYLGVYLAGQVAFGLLVLPRNPEMVAERTQMARRTARNWDRPLAGIVSLFGPLSTLVLAGLDVRFGWSPVVPVNLRVGALGALALATGLTVWAMWANPFFYGFVRIRKDRGHKVATSGPYRWIRHPGYAGGALFALATPLLLGALWAYLPALVTVSALIVRTALEDRTLLEELDGYVRYARQVRWRLLPGVW